MFPAPLLISQNVLTWSKYALQTYSNPAVIAINQDPVKVPGARLFGDDLAFPCKNGPAGGKNECTNVWGRKLSDGGSALVFVNNHGAAGVARITCDAACLGKLSELNKVNGEFEFEWVGKTAKDLWTNSTVTITSAGLTVPVHGNGSSRIFRVLH